MIAIYPMSVSTPAQRVISTVHKVPDYLKAFITKNTRYIIDCPDAFTMNWIAAQYDKVYSSGNIVVVEY